jgi:hypothetical protein
LEWDQGEPAKAYASWAANMALAQNTGVPWIMCKEDDAPDPIVCITLPFSKYNNCPVGIISFLIL